MRTYLFAGGLCLALLLVAGVWRPRATVAQPVLGPGPIASRQLRIQTVHAVGTVACSGAACHGQEHSRAAANVGLDEYRLWNLWDPHARAYHALEGQRAEEIIAHLARAGGFNKKATEEPRCLVCHADLHLATETAAQDLRVHGVGCEACHGAAGRWLTPHHAEIPPSREELEQLGMRDLVAPSTLATVCAGCHVGAPPEHEGQPAREVTHDFLASGHPRLNFELTAYLANLPPHWNTQKKGRVRGPDFDEPRVWAAGQVMAARASLRLLAYQASRDSPWPEFAVHDCEACHTALRPKTNSTGKTLPMSRWHFALLNEVATQSDEAAPGAKRVVEQLADLRSLLEKPFGNSNQVAAKANAAAMELSAWDAWIKQWKSNPANLMRKIGEHLPSDSWKWEEAAQRYLALSALERARHTGANAELHKRIDNELLALAEKLAFPPLFSGPRYFSDDEVLRHFRRIRDQLGEGQ
jgi:hypothetical protein